MQHTNDVTSLGVVCMHAVLLDFDVGLWRKIHVFTGLWSTTCMKRPASVNARVSLVVSLSPLHALRQLTCPTRCVKLPNAADDTSRLAR